MYSNVFIIYELSSHGSTTFETGHSLLYLLSDWWEGVWGKSNLPHKPLSGADTVGSLPKLKLKLKYIIVSIIGDYKDSLINLN